MIMVDSQHQTMVDRMRIGTLHASFGRICEVLGPPELNSAGAGLSLVSWQLHAHGKPVVSVYDYPLTSESVQNVFEWSVGGRDRSALRTLGRVFNRPGEVQPLHA